jgi:hypothetical protein
MAKAPSSARVRAVRLRIVISAALGLTSALFTYGNTHEWDRACIVAYVFWSSFWGFVLLWPAFKSMFQSHRDGVVRTISFFHWLPYYVVLSELLGILGGGLCCFLKELLSLWGVRYPGC